MSSAGRPGHGGTDYPETRVVEIALDQHGTQRAAVEWIGVNARTPTNWVLLRTIPITINLSSVLQRLVECEQSCVHVVPEEAPSASSSCSTSFRELSAGSSGAAGERGCTCSPGSCIRGVRVGYVIGEVHCYCLLVQCCCWVTCDSLQQALQASHGPCAELTVELIMPTTRRVLDGSDAASASRMTEGDALGPPDSRASSLDALVSPSPGIDCPICLIEPLSARAAVTTLCRHTFHLRCYAKASETSGCPICRLALFDLLSNAHCESCGTSFDLWACLTCGHVGCGQTGRGNHQKRHFLSTGHPCAVQCATNRIWNHLTGMLIHQEVATLLLKAEERRSAGKRHDDPLFDPYQWLVDMSWSTQTSPTPPAPSPQGEHEASPEQLVQAHYTQLVDSLKLSQRNWFMTGAAEERLRCLIASVWHPPRVARSTASWGERASPLDGGPTDGAGRRYEDAWHCWMAIELEERDERSRITAAHQDEWERRSLELLSHVRRDLRAARDTVRLQDEAAELLQQRVRNLEYECTRTEAQMATYQKNFMEKMKNRRSELQKLEDQLTAALE